MFCEKCGIELPEGTMTCPKCGTEMTEIVKADEKPVTFIPDEQVDIESVSDKIEPRGFKFKGKMIAIIAAAVVVLGGGITAASIGVANSRHSKIEGFQLAERYLSELHYEQAIIEYQKVLEIEPMNVDAYLGIAQAYLGLGDTESALEWLRKGLELTGDSRLQDMIDEINRSLQPPVVSSTSSESTSTPEKSEPEEIPQYEHSEVANMLLGYFNGTGEVDEDMLKSIRVFGVKPSGFDVVLHSEDGSGGVHFSEPYELYDNKFFIECPINSSEKINIISDMTNCYEIFVDGFTIDDYSIFSNIKDLQLCLYHCGITDVTPIGKLTNLKGLDLWANQIIDISPLSNLTNLTFLSLYKNNQISDISPLANLTNLKSLWLWNNHQITDISPLENLTNLSVLYLNGNKISDISPLASLTNLDILGLSVNKIADISPLANLTNLECLWLNSNQISDITPLANLTNLTGLSLSANQISDISPLANLTNLTSLDLRENQISDISALANLTNLENLSLGGTQISDISPLANLTNLKHLYLSSNQISDISPLANLKNLWSLTLDGNQISAADKEWLKQQLPNCDFRG